MPIHSFSLVPAAYIFLIADAAPHPGGSSSPRVLLQLRRNTGYMDGYWACGVAGHVEEGESVITTAIREAREEVGVTLAEADLVPLTAMHRTNEPGGAALEQRIDMFFTARHWEGEPHVCEPAKNGGLQWCALDALPDLVPPHERYVLGLLREALAGGEPVPAVTTFGWHGEHIARYEVAREH